ncbi:hypothetical protein PUN4_600169 [Paraburkholderia unamae]|nr:hypothetical protein PUN4_600169 [Paraburkholderia unamae]
MLLLCKVFLVNLTECQGRHALRSAGSTAFTGAVLARRKSRRQDVADGAVSVLGGIWPAFGMHAAFCRIARQRRHRPCGNAGRAVPKARRTAGKTRGYRQ